MNDNNIKTITFFFPMFNEERYAAKTVRMANEIAERMAKNAEISDYEILVVDDCSTDRTYEILKVLAESNHHLRIIRHEKNRKLGGALKTGLYNSSGDAILYSDADLPFDLAEVSKALRLMRMYDADIVSSYRHDRTGEGPRRAIYSYVYNFIIRSLFGLRVRDVNFSFKLICRSILEKIKLKSEGSFIDAELLIRADRMGYRIIQFGTDYFPRSRGVSTLSGADIIINILREIFSQYRELKSLKKNKM